MQEALKFMRHGRRETLTCDDINFALRARSCDPLYGYSGTDPPRFCRAKGTQAHAPCLAATPARPCPKPWLRMSGWRAMTTSSPNSAQRCA